MDQFEIKKFLRKMKSIYQGDPWYGKSIKKALLEVDPENVFAKPIPEAHSIVEIVAHMISWRELLSRRLNGDTVFSVRQKLSFDWRQYDPDPQTAWRSLLKRLDDNQKQIIARLERADDVLLVTKVAKRKYTFRHLIQGIIEHDIYHLAQIVLLAKGGA